jgi:hypothetical protein
MEFEITNVKNIYEAIASEFSDKRYTCNLLQGHLRLRK